MSKKAKSISEKVYLGIVLAPFLFFSVVYFISDSLTVYDAPGHLQLIWQIKNFLWPFPNGWNGFSLLGFDQGRFYPPLFHYLAANLSFGLNIEIATKILLVLASIAVPYSIFSLTKNFSENTKERIFYTGVTTLIIGILPGYLGANLKALTQIGLLTSFVSLPLLFFYLNSLIKIDRKGWFLPTVLLSALILTHIVAAVVGFIFLFSVIFVFWVRKNLSKNFLWHIIFSICLTSFFTVPFILNREFISPSVHLGSLGYLNFLCVFLSICFLIIFNRLKNWVMLILAVSTLILSFGTSFDYLNDKFFNSFGFYEQVYSLHLYRYQVYQYLLITLIVLYFPTRFLFSQIGKNEVRLFFAALFPSLTLLIILIFRSPIVTTEANFSLKDKTNLKGRFIEGFSRQLAAPFPYAMQYQLIERDQKNWAYGLFTDSSPNGPYLSSLIRSINPQRYQEPRTNLIEEQIIEESKLNQVLSLFGIENILVLDPTLPEENKGLAFQHLDLGRQELVEIPKHELRAVDENWVNRVENWWKDSSFEDLLVEGDISEFDEKDKNEAQVEILKPNPNFSRFNLKIDSQNEVPVLIKLGYSPNWEATQGSNELKIHRVSPNLMMVFAKGDVEFDYKRLWYENISLLVSLFSLTLLVLLKSKILTKYFGK